MCTYDLTCSCVLIVGGIDKELSGGKGCSLATVMEHSTHLPKAPSLYSSRMSVTLNSVSWQADRMASDVSHREFH